MVSFLVILIGLALYAFLVSWAAGVARAKGHSFVVFVVLAIVFPFIGVIAAILVRDRRSDLTAGAMVTIDQPVVLEGGDEIPSGHRSMVHAVDVIDSTAVVEVDGPAGAKVWVARDNVIPS